MPLDLPTLAALVPLCAPQVSPATLLAVAQVESGLDPLAIHVNGVGGGRIRAAGVDAAVAASADLIRRGRSVDLGLGQINSANLGWLGLSVREAFDPCRNLSAAARVLQQGYARSAAVEPQAALGAALSYYNTGHPQRGFANGYVARVRAAAIRLQSGDAPQAPAAEPPAWDVLARARRGERRELVFASGVHP